MKPDLRGVVFKAGIVAVILSVGWMLLAAEPARECRVHRSGFVSVLSFPGMQCAALPLARVEPGVAPASSSLLQTLASVLLTLLLAGPVRGAIRLRAPAARAVESFYASAFVLGLIAAFDPRGAAFERLELMALLIGPASLAHLALCFPNARPLLDRAPALVRLPYAMAAAFFLIGLRILEVDTLLWPAFCALVLLTDALCLGLLVLRSYLALRESDVPLERVRAGAVLAGPCLVGLPALLLLPEASSAGQARLVSVGLLGLLVCPLPVALASSGYDLFDWRLDVERLGARGRIVARAAVAAVVGGALFAAIQSWVEAGWSLASAALLAATAVACAAFGAASGRRFLAPGARERRHAERLARFGESVVELRWEGSVATCLADFVRETLPAGRGAIYSVEGRAPVLLVAWGIDPPRSPQLASTCLRWLHPHPSRSLWHGSPAEREECAWLLDAGVEFVQTLRASGEIVGLLLASVDSGALPTRAELSVVAAAAGQAGTALANTRLAVRWAESERRAATGRAALTLAHDLHKELAWIRRLAQKLSRDPTRVARDAASIEALATERADALRRFVSQAMEDGQAAPIPLREVLERAIGRVGRRLPALHTRCVLETQVGQQPCDPRVADVIADLIDNAARASAPGQLVLVHASLGNGRLSLAVRDLGNGFSRDGAASGSRLRLRGDGCGVGLALAREIVGSLGGGLDLRHARGGGTRVSVDLPALALEPVG